MATYVISYQTEYTGQHRGQPLAAITAETPRQAIHRFFSDKRRHAKVDGLQFLSPDESANRPLQHVAYVLSGEEYDFWMYADAVVDMTKGEW